MSMSDFAISIQENYCALLKAGIGAWSAAAITAFKFGVSIQDVQIVVNDIMGDTYG